MKPRQLLALAWRESRFARRRLLLFLSAISLGVAALVAVQSFASGMAAGVREQARALVGADVVLEARQPFGEGTEALLDSLRSEGVPIARQTSFASVALVPRTGGTRLAQVRAVEGGFPFYGAIETRPAGRWAGLQAGRNALVDPALLVATGARVGDTIALGEARFRVVGALEKVPGDVEFASAFAPRIFIPARFLPETELLQFGSRIEHSAFLQLPAPGAAERFVDARERLFRAERIRSDTAEEQQQELTDALARLGSYLGLVGIFALLLGGIGVASAMGAYMKRKADTVATLRCLGATTAQVFAVYLVQAAIMGFIGSMIGVALGLLAQWALPRLTAGLLPVEVRLGIDPGVIFVGLGVGVWIALAFALLPLLETRRISPLQALRRSTSPADASPRDPWRWAAWTALLASALAVAMLQAGDARVGAAFAAGIGVTLGVLWLAAWGVARAVRSFPAQGVAYPVRQGIANLHRPGNQTRVVVLALGFGVFLLATLFLTQYNLLRPLQRGGDSPRANLVLWDVQEDQAPSVEALLRERGLPVLQQAPIVPMRVAEIDGRDVRAVAGSDNGGPEEGPPGDEPEGWAIRREYRSTFRDTLVASERLLAGEWWTGDRQTTTDSSTFPVSLERDIAGDLGVGIGSRITWDVQGVEIPTVVTSLREVDWARFEPNFFAVFPAAALAGAPSTRVLLTRSVDAAQRAVVQRDLVQRFPNVAVLDLTQVLAALDDVIGQVSTVIRFLAGFSIATGFIVLLGAIATGRLQRIRESVLLKTLGATRRQVRVILFVEYLSLGVLASMVGAVLATAAAWALARWQFDLPFGVPVPELVGLAGIVTLLAVAVGLWSSREVFRHTPMEALREE